MRDDSPRDWREARRLVQERLREMSERTREVLDGVRQEAGRLRDQLHRAAGGGDGQPSALSTFVKPNLGSTPEPLRRLLEPVVAAVAMAAMGLLLLVGAGGFALVIVAATLLYAIVTYVFGIDLDLKMPV